MKKIVIGLFLFSLNSYSFALERADVAKMVDDMVTKGIISKEEGAKAKKKLSGMSDQKWQKAQKQGAQLAKQFKANNPNVGNNVNSAVNNIDLKSIQFKKVQEQMKKALAD